MRRRTLLTAVAGVMIAECSTATPSAGPADDGPENRSASDEGADGESDPDDDQPSESELRAEFETGLEDRGFEGVTVEEADDGLELRYDATGTSDDDVAAEIELITDGYTTGIDRGSSTAFLDATAYDRDDALDSFTIDTEWVEAYLEGDLEWRELLTRIAETFESDGLAGDEDDADDDSDGGDDDDSDGDGDDSEDD